MKYLLFAILLLLLIVSPSALAAMDSNQTFEGKGEVMSVDPMYGRVTIKHDAIKGFAGDEETVFVVKDSALLKEIARRDLVEFTVRVEKDEATVEKITKVGVAPEKNEGLPVGQAVQGVLVATGEAAKAVTSPIPPAHEVVSGAVGATTDATGSVLDDATTEVKRKF